MEETDDLTAVLSGPPGFVVRPRPGLDEFWAMVHSERAWIRARKNLGTCLRDAGMLAESKQRGYAAGYLRGYGDGHNDGFDQCDRRNNAGLGR